MRFDEYMARCLYHPSDGFYTSGRGVAGRPTGAGRPGGDFITSPEVGPLFGAVLARWLDDRWAASGHPDPFVVVDVGSGPGTLLRAIEMAGPACLEAWQPSAVDVADPQPEPVSLAGAVVMANELLDNIPFRIVERQADGWHEVFVADGGEVLRPFAGDALQLNELGLTVGQRGPLLEQASAWVKQTLAAGPTDLLIFDYGAPTTAALSARGGWLRTYREHRRAGDPYVDPGSWDITTDVAFDQLPGVELASQADFLRTWGIDELVEEGNRYWRDHAAAPDLLALRMRSRASERPVLTDPEGLGSWLVAHYRS